MWESNPQNLRSKRSTYASSVNGALAPSVRFELTHTGLEDLLLYPNSEGKRMIMRFHHPGISRLDLILIRLMLARLRPYADIKFQHDCLVRTTRFELVQRVWKTIVLPLHQVRMNTWNLLSTCLRP